MSVVSSVPAPVMYVNSANGWSMSWLRTTNGLAVRISTISPSLTVAAPRFAGSYVSCVPSTAP
jgi:hypothetical protein